MQLISPCLWFDDEAEEAAEFYTSLFPDSTVLDVSRYGPDAPLPEGTALVVRFSLSGFEMEALNGGKQPFAFSEALSLSVSTASQEETDHYWFGLTDGGGEPGVCGWLKDRYGVSWQIVPDALTRLLVDPDRAKVGRVTAALMAMTRIDIAALETAAE